jgi:hypothetical protein
MAEVGIDIAAEQPKLLSYAAAQDSDVVITIGCGDPCPIFPGKRYEDWQLEDPAGKTSPWSAASAMKSATGCNASSANFCLPPPKRAVSRLSKFCCWPADGQADRLVAKSIRSLATRCGCSHNTR